MAEGDDFAGGTLIRPIQQPGFTTAFVVPNVGLIEGERAGVTLRHRSGRGSGEAAAHCKVSWIDEFRFVNKMLRNGEKLLG